MSDCFVRISQTADVFETETTPSSATTPFALGMVSAMPWVRPAFLPASMYTASSATYFTRKAVLTAGVTPVPLAEVSTAVLPAAAPIAGICCAASFRAALSDDATGVSGAFVVTGEGELSCAPVSDTGGVDLIWTGFSGPTDLAALTITCAGSDCPGFSVTV